MNVTLQLHSALIVLALLPPLAKLRHLTWPGDLLLTKQCRFFSSGWVVSDLPRPVCHHLWHFICWQNMQK